MSGAGVDAGSQSPPIPALTSAVLADLSLSVLIPAEGWRASVEPRTFRVFGPEQPQLDGYSPTMSFLVGKPEGSDQEWFDAFTAAAQAGLEAGLANFWLNRVERFELSSLVPVHAIWFEWINNDSGLHFVQLEAFIASSPDEMYVVRAATQKAIEHEFVPTFDAILRSTRILRGYRAATS